MSSSSLSDDFIDRRNRRGLPIIPKDRPQDGDQIDLHAIEQEYQQRLREQQQEQQQQQQHTRRNNNSGGDDSTQRITRRSSPLSTASATSFESASFNTSSAAAPSSIPMRTMRGGDVMVEDETDENDEDSEFNYVPPERRFVRRRPPTKTALTAAFLLTVGVIFSILGITFVFTLGMGEALPFLIIGGIGFIPGSYASFILYQAWRGVPGYSYDQIPSYDE